MSWLYQLPLWLFALIVVGGFVLFSVLGLVLFQRYIANRTGLSEEMNNDVIFFASTIGVFYSLTVGLIAVGVWTNYTQVQDIVSGEAVALGALYRDVSGFPEPYRSQLQQDIRDYTEFVIEKAWPAQRNGIILDMTTERMSQIQDHLYNYEPATPGKEAIYAETLRQFNDLIVLRRRRIDAIDGGLPTSMWAIVLIGAVLTITVTYLLKIQQPVHSVLTAFMALFIGLVIFVVAGLDNPLSGPLAIGSDSYQLILDRLINMK